MGDQKLSSTSMLSALGLQLISKYANVAVQLVVSMILARILTPGEYGTVAIVTVFTSFFAILADMGISTAIVQYKDLTKSDYNGLFTFSCLLSLLLAGLFCLISIPISAIYAETQLVPLCCFASLSVLFNTLNMVPNGILMKERRFKTISLRLVVVSVLSGMVAVLLALLGCGCYALIWNSIISAALIFLWNWAATKVVPNNLHFRAPLKRIARFSIYQGGFSIVNYFARNLDNLLVGAVMGSAQLGYYDKAYKLMQYPLNYLTGIFSSVLQPYLSDYQNDKKKLYTSWLSICRVLAVVGMLVTAVFVSFPEEIVVLMYGDQWTFAAPALAGLGISVGVQMVNSTSGAIFQSSGHTDVLFRSGLICTAVSLVAIGGGVALGSLAALGCAISVAYLIHFAITIYLLVWKVLDVKPVHYLVNFVPAVAAALISLCVSTAVTNAASAVLFGTGTIALRALVLLFVYALVIWITGEYRAFGAFAEMKKIGASNSGKQL